MDKSAKIYIAGHRGLVGSSIMRRLKEQGYNNLLTVSHADLDLTQEQAVHKFFVHNKPEYVFLAAAKVGGIYANNLYRADFIYTNLQIQNNLIHQSYLHKVKKLLFLGSSCIYPKNAPQPITENSLLTGELEYTNEPYAIAKIAGIKMCESYNLQYKTNFISVMPTNLYGENDNFDLYNSHVMPAMMRKMLLAKWFDEGAYNKIRANLAVSGGVMGDNISELELKLSQYGIKKESGQTVLQLWGSGEVYREFLHVDDMADACIFIMDNVNFSDLINNNNSQDVGQIKNTHINIGCGQDITIKELSVLIKEQVGFSGNIEFDRTKPEGVKRKLLDTSKLTSLGFKPKIELARGIESTLKWYLTDKA